MTKWVVAFVASAIAAFFASSLFDSFFTLVLVAPPRIALRGRNPEQTSQ